VSAKYYNVFDSSILALPDFSQYGKKKKEHCICIETVMKLGVRHRRKTERKSFTVIQESSGDLRGDILLAPKNVLDVCVCAHISESSGALKGDILECVGFPLNTVGGKRNTVSHTDTRIPWCLEGRHSKRKNVLEVCVCAHISGVCGERA